MRVTLSSAQHSWKPWRTWASWRPRSRYQVKGLIRAWKVAISLSLSLSFLAYSQGIRKLGYFINPTYATRLEDRFQNRINSVSSNRSSIPALQVALTNLILICVCATVEWCPFRVVLEEAHSFRVLLVNCQMCFNQISSSKHSHYSYQSWTCDISQQA